MIQNLAMSMSGSCQDSKVFMTCMIHNHIQHTHMDLHGLYVEHACHIHKAAGQVSSILVNGHHLR